MPKCPHCKRNKPESEFRSLIGNRMTVNCRSCLNSTSRHKHGACASAMDLIRTGYSDSVVQTHIGSLMASKAARFKRFYAFEPGEGYLHQSGCGYVEETSYAWSGTVTQFRNLCRQFGYHASDFVLRTVARVDPIPR